MEENKELINETEVVSKDIEKKVRKPRVKVADLKAEIESLKKENEELKAKLENNCICEECSYEDNCDCKEEKDCCPHSTNEKCNCNSEECCCNEKEEDNNNLKCKCTDSFRGLDVIKILLTAVFVLLGLITLITCITFFGNIFENDIPQSTTKAVLVKDREGNFYLTEQCRDMTCSWKQDGYTVTVYADAWQELPSETMKFNNYGVLATIDENTNEEIYQGVYEAYKDFFNDVYSTDDEYDLEDKIDMIDDETINKETVKDGVAKENKKA